MVMTLKGKHNHYNVKFLKGYGFSVRVKDSKIVLEYLGLIFRIVNIVLIDPHYDDS